MSTHEQYMQRCLQIAPCGLGSTAPNPMVGAVLVHDSKIVSEGYHHGYGLPHAEVEAIRKVKDKSILRQCTLYVSLEPCNHYGKTPPCSELIAASKIPRVVVATTDPFPKVNGSGIRRLQEAGAEVVVGVLEKAAREQNRRFFTFHEKTRPYVTLKWAQTIDGFIDRVRTAKEVPAKISNETAHTLSHRWRTEEPAIMVGANTVIMDNPSLTARLWEGKNPTRVVVGSSLNALPKNLNIFNSEAPTITIESLCPKDILKELYKQNVQSVMVEGGAKLLNKFIESGLWDEARIFTSQDRLGSGIAAPKITGATIYKEMVGDNLLEILQKSTI
ncbi:MAG: bifunctional diaminohydroxyphosphoribosylaminopyrimidine deaminase/5-amino-6-(5-phosphoribosylamino)uracil reductase RibD [Prevotellaceae bacterium]|jgi:diaminohydroxyphosphoribosylaminopyrimidine deaminase/5-amino-6-(5-phosphoribosylamino)uracil reductase|nr:bifunctional diaminohydroxyphosphoribosylaminopyrimidine deaminase/5-amino-6-(5-phosphoribosylamino)uracil reductase RibD [Prevotellaceae bacterium]